MLPIKLTNLAKWEPRALKSDRLFVFVIRDLDTGAALYLDRVKDRRG